MKEQKSAALNFIQHVWVIEGMVVLLYTMIIVPFVSSDRLEEWLKLLPFLLAIIGGKGTIAAVCPLVSDHIKSKSSVSGVDNSVMEPSNHSDKAGGQ
jgi:hypothetical protein